ncbi:hypothetical protein A2853_01120 [Candidatus Kaiserbacteria bacterium RIFCSPHIGHO2_01_FULL_55_17]|uniref:ABC transporter substrate-binding protein n=1 Tax=Candidatus Kaiserbacteria bacterium RIFCSPHIGHO2_01_FULL_55_17 TaxID=1798484 RepID=A0A1F6D9P3_9BACT|nr:MAG: hypothetical protein A2853_01120 [Candidatus Kaiserbacteria bacterium RIFCSPHIGHO2_01_FULL_55_17]
MEPQQDSGVSAGAGATTLQKHRWQLPLIVAVAVLAAIALAILAILPGGSMKEAAAPKHVTIGILRALDVHDPIVASFKQQMASYGYEEGKNVDYIITDYGRTADGTAKLAQELVAGDPDLIVALSGISAYAALDATKAADRTDIPIVYSHALVDPKRTLFNSYQSSGNNATGILAPFDELVDRKLDFLRAIAPAAKRLGYFDLKGEKDFAYPANLAVLKRDAEKFGFELVPYTVNNPLGAAVTAEIQSVADSIKPGDIDVYFNIPGAILSDADNTPIVAAMAVRLGIPSAWTTPTDLLRGGLFTYQYDLANMGIATAAKAKAILDGAKPTDIPVEGAQQVALFLNPDAAAAARLTIPDNILYKVNKEIHTATSSALTP